MNSSSLRGKSQILQELDGVLNSHHVSNNNNIAQNQNSSSCSISNFFKKNNKQETADFKIEKFFKSNSENKSQSGESIKTQGRKKRKISLRRETLLTQNSNKNKKKKLKRKDKHIEDDEEESEEDDEEDFEDDYEVENVKGKITNNEKPLSEESVNETSVNIHKESLILFDEIEVVFKEDVGFWSAINHFVKKSKKPVILTTNDEYLQHKINLNIEKIDFLRPRVDASIKFLKKIAEMENVELETPVAYEIVRESKCDMRRALIQMQALLSSNQSTTDQYSINSNSTLSLDKYLPQSLLESTCNWHRNLKNSENLIFLDNLTKQFKQKSFQLNSNFEMSTDVKKYDSILIRDGLSDNTDLFNNSSSAMNQTASSNNSFNPFIQQSNLDLSKFHFEEYNLTSSIDQLNELYDIFINLFNKNKYINFYDWNKFGFVNTFNYTSSPSINKFAQYNYKFTSNSALSLDYRAFLQQICRIEECRQIGLKRR